MGRTQFIQPTAPYYRENFEGMELLEMTCFKGDINAQHSLHSEVQTAPTAHLGVMLSAAGTLELEDLLFQSRDLGAALDHRLLKLLTLGLKTCPHGIH